ncbi:NAD(P)/FAD-dependent oxidoreductase [Streptomyces neyagawaensis]|uniref:NAD(P)/FAD-dependent oxidoreductase n=1 Tax=Streptomyces neyagawaensis TaxID=42238 RepID=UPI00201D061E|nr:FAD-dependent monooxygenase [Streptomyces neyagawaensis]MCL6732513.1 FAD-dependent monooxygenase [Streptomyces neyagawaensis]MDE1687152.1 FAD-dependent monooxygenase [Streptomyces neyagawaensis]
MDLLVVGGGPAGLASALHAARAGLDVAVWEQRAGTVDKACGEGLMPGAVTALAALGLDPPGKALRGIRYVAERHRVDADFAAGPGRGVRRTTLHAALREAVLDAGVRIEQRTARRVEQDDDGVRVDGTRAAHLVAADGLHSPIRRALGLDRPRRIRSRHGAGDGSGRGAGDASGSTAGDGSGRGAGRGSRHGLRRHYQLAPWSDHVEVHWAPRAEAYVTPVADDLVGVAVLTAARGSFDDHLAAFPELRERLAGSAPAGPVRGAGPLRQDASARTAGRVLLVGDAAGYVDALTGEGIALALAQAQAAVRAVVEGDVAGYEREWRRLTRRYRWLTHALLGATRVPPVRGALVPLAQRLPWLFTAAVDVLAAPVRGDRAEVLGPTRM